MGGKNAQIVLDDANLELALDGALWGSFGTTGQRCTATSRILLQKGIARKFTERFVERAEVLRVGNGLDESVEVGPQVNASQIETSNKYVDIALAEHAKLLLGGGPLTDGDFAKGTFFAPTIFGGVNPCMRIAREEVFGPVVSLIEFDTFEQAVEIANSIDYGLSTALYTRPPSAQKSTCPSAASSTPATDTVKATAPSTSSPPGKRSTSTTPTNSSEPRSTTRNRDRKERSKWMICLSYRSRGSTST
jgi:acyl-CoA reductase-like NAD-dependent aldehyde dehydrogenase